MNGRHCRPPVFPRWLTGAGVGAAVLLIGSLALVPAETPLPTFRPGNASLALPRSPAEPLVAPTPAGVSTPPTTTPGRRVRAGTADGVDTTSQRRRNSTTAPETTTKAPKSSTTTPTTTKTVEDKPDVTPAAAKCSTSLEGTRPHVAAAGYKIKAATGFTGTILGRAGRAGGGDHPKGLALDFMTSNGSPILAYARAHFAELGITYVIYRQTYYPARGGSKRMENRGSDTANHLDHVHVSFNPQPGTAAAGC